MFFTHTRREKNENRSEERSRPVTRERRLRAPLTRSGRSRFRRTAEPRKPRAIPGPGGRRPREEVTQSTWLPADRERHRKSEAPQPCKGLGKSGKPAARRWRAVSQGAAWNLTMTVFLRPQDPVRDWAQVRPPLKLFMLRWARPAARKLASEGPFLPKPATRQPGQLSLQSPWPPCLAGWPLSDFTRDAAKAATQLGLLGFTLMNKNMKAVGKERSFPLFSGTVGSASCQGSQAKVPRLLLN